MKTSFGLASWDIFIQRKAKKAVDRQIRRDERQGFIGIRDHADFFKYEMNRDKYPNMDFFVPRIATCFEQYAASVNEGT